MHAQATHGSLFAIHLETLQTPIINRLNNLYYIHKMECSAIKRKADYLQILLRSDLQDKERSKVGKSV